MDAEKRQNRERDLQQREQEREQEKKAFQEQQRAEEEREKARVAALLERPAPGGPVADKTKHSSSSPADKYADVSPQGVPTTIDVNEENAVKTLVLIEKIGKSNIAFRHSDNTVTYKNKSIDVTEAKSRSEGSFNYQSSVVHDVREAVCSGFNAAVLSVEAPNTASRFDSPVWPVLNRIVRSVLHANTQENGELNPHFDLTCAFGYINNDRVKDLLSEDESSPFESIVVHPSPIYGPRIQQLRYGQITSGNGFEEVLSASLSRASEDTVLSTMTEGVAVAFVLAKQIRIVDGKEDIFLSSLVVASAGSDATPYECGLNRIRNDYGTIFHLVLGGPCYTCFMFNTADDDSIRVVGGNKGESAAQELSRLFDLLEKMAVLKNYPLRSGSVKRFIKFVEKALQEGQNRLKGDVDDTQRAKLERYTNEQQRLLKGAYKMLEDAGISATEV
ncbi:hypothetical protein STCU_11158 [Strigomonas culicis]|uniref:Uncharacterized protein n=1 Tax=Strigomonas culicis TaxID=28005 RepID=S9TJK3_9TRYP|nr:hypothetical protein STCU_11158 [Strigomonas culicis]|eukprot:EPY16538.1 hypothetical protein STCU_11158 [Strigomonas culicis]